MSIKSNWRYLGGFEVTDPSSRVEPPEALRAPGHLLGIHQGRLNIANITQNGPYKAPSSLSKPTAYSLIS